jgi:hypothetical protein
MGSDWPYRYGSTKSRPRHAVVCGDNTAPPRAQPSETLRRNQGLRVNLLGECMSCAFGPASPGYERRAEVCYFPLVLFHSLRRLLAAMCAGRWAFSQQQGDAHTVCANSRERRRISNKQAACFVAVVSEGREVNLARAHGPVNHGTFNRIRTAIGALGAC